jgi:sugar (pentulose or hexulose) kinase
VNQPIASRNFNIRRHAIPGRWLTFFVLNTGGKALEWFHANLCRDMTEEHFYGEYIPGILRRFFDSPNPDAVEAEWPEYGPFLGGSRYTLERLKASFSGVCLETTREDLLLSLIRGNALYVGGHLKEVASLVNVGRKVAVSGGGATIRGFMDVKKRWTGNYDYEYHDQCSLTGAAMLGQLFLNAD